MKPVFQKPQRLGLAVALILSSIGVATAVADPESCGECANAYSEAMNDANAAYDECVMGCGPSSAPGCETSCDLARTAAVESATSGFSSCMADNCENC